MIKLFLFILLFPFLLHAEVSPTIITVNPPLTIDSGNISCPTASGSQAGCLSSANWSLFNSKLSSVVWGGIGGTLSNQTDLQAALNAKQATGSYLTALTGDVSATGPGSAAGTVNFVGGATASHIGTVAGYFTSGKMTIPSDVVAGQSTFYPLATSGPGYSFFGLGSNFQVQIGSNSSDTTVISFINNVNASVGHFSSFGLVNNPLTLDGAWFVFDDNMGSPTFTEPYTFPHDGKFTAITSITSPTIIADSGTILSAAMLNLGANRFIGFPSIPALNAGIGLFNTGNGGYFYIGTVANSTSANALLLFDSTNRANSLDVIPVTASNSDFGSSGSPWRGIYLNELAVKTGSNKRAGTAILGAGGTVTVSNTSVTANTLILVSENADGGTPGSVRVNNIVPNTSFDIISSDAGDTSTVAWFMVEGF